MARKARVEFEGAVYHVLDRGDRREAIRPPHSPTPIPVLTVHGAAGRESNFLAAMLANNETSA